jgi:hypothetical protein
VQFPVPSFVAAHFAGDGQSFPECQPFPALSFVSANGQRGEERKSACVSHKLLQQVAVIELTYILMQGIQNQGFEFIEAVIDSRTTPLLHDRLCGTTMLTGSLIRRLFGDFDVETGHR